MPVAVPAITRPAPNSTGDATSGTLGPATSHQRPPSTVPNTPAAMNATNGHAYSDTAPMSATRAGMAVPTPIASNATMLTSSGRPMVVVRRLGPNRSERTGATSVSAGRALMATSSWTSACNLNPGAGQGCSGG